MTSNLVRNQYLQKTRVSVVVSLCDDQVSSDGVFRRKGLTEGLIPGERGDIPSKMKLITVQYLGFTAMDRRFSAPMLPWIVSEIRKRDSYEQVIY